MKIVGSVEHFLYCPYCGERISILIDPSDPDQQYIEDCEVCCRPIQFIVSIDDDGQPSVIALREDDSF